MQKTNSASHKEYQDIPPWATALCQLPAMKFPPGQLSLNFPWTMIPGQLPN